MANRQEAHRSLYSFAYSQNSPPPPSPGQKADRGALSEAQLIQLRHNSAFNPVQTPPLGTYPLPPDLPETPRLTYNEMIDQIARLEEVICYLGKDKLQLKDECSTLQQQSAALRAAASKQKEGLQSQIRKLKQELLEKDFECERILKTGRKQKQMLQKQNQRINNHIKTMIQKRTNQMFELEQEKQAVFHNMKRELENLVDDQKTARKRESQEMGSKIEQAREETARWKQKYKEIQDEMDALDRRYEDAKLRIIEENQNNMGQLKHKYHRTKMLLIETGMQEAKNYEESASIQKEVFTIEAEELRAVIDRQRKQNDQLREQMQLKDKNWGFKIQENLSIIRQLEEKLKQVHQKKQQELQIAKIKASELHQSELRALENVYSTKMKTLDKKIDGKDGIISRLETQLAQQLDRNRHLVSQMRSKQTQFNEDLSRLKAEHANREQAIHEKHENERAVVSQQSTYTVKLLESKVNQIEFKQKQLAQLRKLLEEKIDAYHRLEELVQQERKQIDEERAFVKRQAAQASSQWQQEEKRLKEVVAEKTAEVDRLNAELNKVISEQIEPDLSQYEEKIANLSQKLREMNASQKDWKEKQHRLEQKIRQTEEESQRVNRDVICLIQQAKKEWLQQRNDRQDEVEKTYGLKIADLQREREQLKAECAQAQGKVHDMTLKYIEMQATLQEALDAMRKRTDLQARIVQLGMDQNLVKNKQQLFEY